VERLVAFSKLMAGVGDCGDAPFPNLNHPAMLGWGIDLRAWLTKNNKQIFGTFDSVSAA
jgi:hypothetical protein